MNLDIIVPHYKEPWEICQYLFNSIAMQRGVSFNNVHVIVVNDGNFEDCNLTADDLERMQTYPYKVDFYTKEHEGVSAARNFGLCTSEADYVMFCDIDDGFLNNYALHLLFSSMQEGFDYCVNAFIEETFNEHGDPIIVNHDRDITFMHGKVYRREFLVEQGLYFDERMTLHEDGYFNMLVLSTAQHEGRVKMLSTPIYMWCWNNQSVVRKDRKDFVLRTYPDVMLTRDGLCEQLKKRGYLEDYQTSVCMTVLNSYYDFQKPAYHEAGNEKYLRTARKAFRGFWMKYRDVFNDCTNQRVAEVAVIARNNAMKNGMLFERQDLKTFLHEIEEDGDESGLLLRIPKHLR